MIAAGFACTLALGLTGPADPDAIEAALERRSSAFEITLDESVALIEADVRGSGSVQARRSRAGERVKALEPVIDDYADYARCAFAALGEAGGPERAAEYKSYAEGLTRYLDGLPEELMRSVDQELVGDL